MTANLQTKGLTITIGEAARLMNVSERMVYMARELHMTGNAALIRAVEQGEMTVHAALKIVKPEKYARKADGFRALMTAWEKANSDERSAFLVAIYDAI